MSIRSNVHFAGTHEDFFLRVQHFCEELGLVGMLERGRGRTERVVDEGKEGAAQHTRRSLAHQCSRAAILVRHEMKQIIHEGFAFLEGRSALLREERRLKQRVPSNGVRFRGSRRNFVEERSGRLENRGNVVGEGNDGLEKHRREFLVARREIHHFPDQIPVLFPWRA